MSNKALTKALIALDMLLEHVEEMREYYQWIENIRNYLEREQ